MQAFIKKIEIIGVNPYVEVPENVLSQLFQQAGKNKGPIPVTGMINGKPFTQTIVKFQGLWRLYLNTPMREASQTKVGDTVTITLEYDSDPRIVAMPQKLMEALSQNQKAKATFNALPPYRQKEINRYLGMIKSEEILGKNVEKVLQYLMGKKVEGVMFR